MAYFEEINASLRSRAFSFRKRLISLVEPERVPADGSSSSQAAKINFFSYRSGKVTRD